MSLEDDLEFGCHFPGECCMPGPHFKSECHTAAMAEEYYNEMEKLHPDAGEVMNPIEIVLSEQSPRYEEWMRVFGTNRVPVLSPVSRPAISPTLEVGRFYQLDVKALQPEQRQRMIENLAQKCGMSVEEVEADIDGEHGMPILDDEYVLCHINVPALRDLNVQAVIERNVRRRGISSKTGVELIAEERQRQLQKCNWSPEHDDEHTRGELAIVGACYANAAASINNGANPEEQQKQLARWVMWPFTEPPKVEPTPHENLVKAGALIAAEIDRLQRAQQAEK
jgi:hypothetical protein